MPRISTFYGIDILMYHREHEPPHFHARYAGESASISIDELKVMSGSLRGRALSFVQEWARMHQSELRANWLLARDLQPLSLVPPLE